MQPAEWPDAADSDRNLQRHPRQDPPVEQDGPTHHLTDVNQIFRVLLPMLAPTEPQVTNVTSASTSRLAVSDDECVATGMLLQPAVGLGVEQDDERRVGRCQEDGPDLLRVSAITSLKRPPLVGLLGLLGGSPRLAVGRLAQQQSARPQTSILIPPRSTRHPHSTHSTVIYSIAAPTAGSTAHRVGTEKTTLHPS